jgi:multisubunit Na+/H+ antiporter MnhB subunit
MRRSIGEWLLSAATVAILLLALIFIYEPVRDDVTRRVMTKPAAEISSVLGRVRHQTEWAAALARETARSNSELTMFAIAAVVLLGFMLRSSGLRT